MKNTMLNQQSKKYYKKILGDYNIKIDIKENLLNLNLDDVFTMAVRNNKKRKFLFVSKLLGKHIAIKPDVGINAGKMLAYRFDFSSLLDKNVLVIGFCETATGIGHSFFDHINLENAFYIHTTRENIKNQKKIEFLEEHSHATEHYLYLESLESFDDIFLVDDEITTGKTMLNIIKELYKLKPIKQYNIATILDWRDETCIKEFEKLEKELNIKINVKSLISGNIALEGDVSEEYLKNIDDKLNIKLDNQAINEKDEEQLGIHYFHLEDVLGKKFSYLDCTGRFLLDKSKHEELKQKCKKIANILIKEKKYEDTLCIGTTEFIYIPMLISSYMGSNIKFQSTTQSPIVPSLEENYSIFSKIQFKNHMHKEKDNFIYNISGNNYKEIFLFIEKEPKNIYELKKLIDEFIKEEIKSINIVYLSRDEIGFSGSYKKEDVTFLLKDISELNIEQSTKQREEAIQSGVHYSSMLPIEYEPSKEYENLFFEIMEKNKEQVAIYTGVLAEQIYSKYGKDTIIVSLARAGTPIGILLKRYLKYKYKFDCPHYSISIIRGIGIDENAINYILNNYKNPKIQFVDGWTGKGAITKTLTKACDDFYNKYGIRLDDSLAVIADTGHCSNLFSTRGDFLIPSACLNSTISGLVSRTFLREDIIGEKDFHGAKIYHNLKEKDHSNYFIDEICKYFEKNKDNIKKGLELVEKTDKTIEFSGLTDIQNIGKIYSIEDINLIKPGVGETTRVLLRRVPWKILIKEDEIPNLEHILLLAKEKEVEIEIFNNMNYACCGLIKKIK